MNISYQNSKEHIEELLSKYTVKELIFEHTRGISMDLRRMEKKLDALHKENKELKDLIERMRNE